MSREHKGRWEDRKERHHRERSPTSRSQQDERRQERKTTSDGRISFSERSRGDFERRERNDMPKDSRHQDKRRHESPDGGRNKREERRDNWKRRDDMDFRGEERIRSEPKDDRASAPKEEVPKELPNFGLSGKLTEDTNKFNGVVVVYNEPPEAKRPNRKWRLYPFKGDQSLDFIPISKQSAFLMGRDRRCVDIPLDHPSVSSQHAVIQFKTVQFEREDGTTGKKCRPYLIDLDSSNGTFLNNSQIEPRKYYELFEKDVIKFAFSTREYVMMHEDVTLDSEDDDDDMMHDMQKKTIDDQKGQSKHSQK